MKNKLILILVLYSMLVSCGGNSAKDKTETTTSSVQQQSDIGGLNIAFYKIDSVATQFGFHKEVDSMLRAKEEDFQKELNRRVSAYRAYEANIQRKIQNYEITGYQLEEVQKTAMQKQQSIQQFRMEKGTELQRKSMAYQIALMNKISEAGKEFSVENGIDILFFYQKGGQITYINNAYDVTRKFISYLNEREKELKLDIEEEVKKLENKDVLQKDPLSNNSPLPGTNLN